MREIPLEVLINFPTPNYTNPQTQGQALIIVNAIFIFFVTVFVVLRLYTRIYLKRWFGTDDVFIILAYIFTVGLTAAVILANVKYFWDRHIWDVPISGVAASEKIAMAAKILFTCASTFTRMSLICFYYRIVGDARRNCFVWVLHVSMAYVVAILILFVVLSIWQCTPVSAYWTIGSTGHCLDEGAVTLAAGIINCTADLLVTVLPIPTVMRLKLPLRQRIGVVILLSLGFIVTIAGIVRTYYIWRALIDTYDESWYTYPLWIAAAVEIDLGLLCACAPALRTLFTTYFPNAGSYASRVSGYITGSKKQSSGSRTRDGKEANATFGGSGTTMVDSRSRSNTTGSEGRSRLPRGVKYTYDGSYPTTPGSTNDIELGMRRPSDAYAGADDDERRLVSSRSGEMLDEREYALKNQVHMSVQRGIKSSFEADRPKAHVAGMLRGGNRKSEAGTGAELTWFDDGKSSSSPKRDGEADGSAGERSSGDSPSRSPKVSSEKHWPLRPASATASARSAPTARSEIGSVRMTTDTSITVSRIEPPTPGSPQFPARSPVGSGDWAAKQSTEWETAAQRKQEAEGKEQSKLKKKKGHSRSSSQPTPLIKDLKEGKMLI